MKKREEILAAVLKDSGLRQTIESLAISGGEDERALVKKTRRYFLEIASDYNERWLYLWDKVLSRLWTTMYDDFVVDQAGMEKIREISRKMPLVVVPCHRSHVDYLILSYILFKNGITLPLIAAGKNMDFWPLGYFFRQSGAFFLRRSFQGNKLYSEVFASYVRQLLKEGIPLEFFIEGGRSRTGKMITPKYGMLSMIIHAYQEKVCDDLALIPVSLGYDRIVEEASYLRELRGVPKKRESVRDILRTARLIGKRYGRAYLSVGTPIFLKTYFSSHPSDFADMDYAGKQSLYRNIGCGIVSEINRVSAVSPTALLAACFLCHGAKETPEDLLAELFTAFYDYLSKRGVNFAPALSATKQEILSAAGDLLCRSGYISAVRMEEGQQEKAIYLLDDEKRLNLEYYKNNIIHHFLAISFVAAAVLGHSEKEIPGTRLREDYCFLKRLFRQEFILGNDDESEIKSALSYLESCGILTGNGEGGFRREGGAEEKLMPFAGLTRSCRESYGVVFNACRQVNDAWKGEKNSLNHIRRLAQEMYEKGDIARTESMSDASYTNALKFLEEEGIINYGSPSGKGTGEGLFQVADEDRLENLRHRLSNFL